LDLEGSQIFPNNNIKQDIVSEYRSSDYNIDDLNYEIVGSKITALDIKLHVDPKKIDDTKTRIDIPLLVAKDIRVSNGGLINLSYKEVDQGSLYGVYDRATNKMTVHVPGSVAARYIKNNNISIQSFRCGHGLYSSATIIFPELNRLLIALQVFDLRKISNWL
jgi:hypothetical protein